MTFFLNPRDQAYIKTWSLVLMTAKFYPWMAHGISSMFTDNTNEAPDCALFLNVHLSVYVENSFNAVCKISVDHIPDLTGTFELLYYRQ